jgi:RNA polymerase sigma-70 factor (ECF subfamily)
MRTRVFSIDIRDLRSEIFLGYSSATNQPSEAFVGVRAKTLRKDWVSSFAELRIASALCLARLIEMDLPDTGATNTARESLSSVDPEAWVDRHGDCLYRYALMRVRHPEVAEDLVQETLLAAVRTHTNFRGTSSERSWLCGILKNKICDHFRKLAREVSYTDLEFLEDEMSHKFINQGWNHDLGPAEWKPEAEAALDRKEFWETFRNCLDKLPQRVADVFMLREMEEMDTAQICEALRISQNNLWVMLHRARMALRECLELNWFGRKSTMNTETDEQRR